ncbi:MAG TPA: hypothetical protein VFZ53_22000, partial [Polyangiaceae bacterium]
RFASVAIAMLRAALVLTVVSTVSCASPGVAPARLAASATVGSLEAEAAPGVAARGEEPAAAPRARLAPPFRRAAGVRRVSEANENVPAADPAVGATAKLGN